MSAAKAIIDHLEDWFNGTKDGEFVSMGIFTESDIYNVPRELVFSMPVKCKNFEWEIVKDLKIEDLQK